MIAAFDVHYLENGCAAAAVLFSDYTDAAPGETYTRFLPGATDYIPGEFYTRELPCILALLTQIHKPLDEMVVDGYVTLGNRPGLGQHLFEAVNRDIPVIGVAKSRFTGADGAEVLRGRSMRPLYITCAGMDVGTAVHKINIMHGAHRIPTLLKQVDLLAREKARDQLAQVTNSSNSARSLSK